GDVWLRSIVADGHRDQRAHKRHACAWIHHSLFDQSVQPWPSEDDHVDRLAAFQPVGDGIRRGAQRRTETADHVDLRFALELRRQLLVGLGEATGGDDTELLREHSGRDQQRNRDQDRGSDGANHLCHDLIYPSTWRASTSSGTTPVVSTTLWEFRSEKRSPSASFAFSRSSMILSCPIM